MTRKPLKCRDCGAEMKAPIGDTCQLCIVDRRRQNGCFFPVGTQAQRERYEAIHGYGAGEDVTKRVRENAARLEKLLGSSVVRATEVEDEDEPAD